MENKKLSLRKMETSRFLRCITTFLIIVALSGCQLWPYYSPYNYPANALIINNQPCFYVGSIYPSDSDTINNSWKIVVAVASPATTEIRYWERKKINYADSKASCIMYGSGTNHTKKPKPLEIGQVYWVSFGTKYKWFAKRPFCLSQDANNKIILIAVMSVDNQLTCDTKPFIYRDYKNYDEY